MFIANVRHHEMEEPRSSIMQEGDGLSTKKHEDREGRIMREGVKRRELGDEVLAR
jgi:hypothetical protein